MSNRHDGTLLREIAQKKLEEFRKSRPVVEPDKQERLEDFIVRVNPALEKPMHLGRGLELMNDVLQGKRTRLLLSVPPRHGKPVHEDTLVTMADGSTKPIKEVRVGDKVISGAGRITTVIEVHDRGVVDVLRIKTRSGREIVAEPTHQFLTQDGWKQAGDLRPYAKQNWQRPRGDFMQVGANFEIAPTNRLTKAEARFLGYMVGDGGCTKGVGFTNACPETIVAFTKCAEAIGAHVRHIHTIQYSVTGPVVNDSKSAYNCAHSTSAVYCRGLCKSCYERHLRLGTLDQFARNRAANPALDLLKRVGLFGCKSGDKFVPEDLFSCSPEIIAEFLAAYFECDGTHSARNAAGKAAANSSFTSISKRLLDGVQVLLARLGIASHVYEKHGKYNGRDHSSWSCCITDDVRFFKLLPIVGYKSAPSDRKPKPAVDKRIRDAVVSVEPAGQARCLCITVEHDSSFLANGFITHNSWSIMYLVAATLLRYPKSRIAYITYSEEFSCSQSRLIKTFCEQAGVAINKRKNADSHWETTAGGSVIATGVGGGITGRGFNLIIVDDPYKSRVDVESASLRQRVADYFDSAIYNRRERQSNIIVVHTRFHDDDLIGNLIRKERDLEEHLKEGWEYVNLPAISLDEHGKEQALWENGPYPISELVKTRARNVFEFAALFMGQPRPRGGAVFNDWNFYEQLPLETPHARAIGIDLAFTAKTYSDYSVAVTALRYGSKIYIANVRRRQCTPTEFAQELKSEKALHPSAPIFWYIGGVEKSTVQLLQNLGVHVRAEVVNSKNDKLIRAQPVATAWNDGNVLLPREAPWLEAFLGEVLTFTGQHDKKDDQVDALAAAYHLLGFKRAVRGIGQQRIVPF